MPFFWHAAGESVEFDIKTKLAFSDVMVFFLFGDVFFLSYNLYRVWSIPQTNVEPQRKHLFVWEEKRQIMPFGFGRSYQLPIECEKTYQAAITIQKFISTAAYK